MGIVEVRPRILRLSTRVQNENILIEHIFHRSGDRWQRLFVLTEDELFQPGSVGKRVDHSTLTKRIDTWSDVSHLRARRRTMDPQPKAKADTLSDAFEGVPKT